MPTIRLSALSVLILLLLAISTSPAAASGHLRPRHNVEKYVPTRDIQPRSEKYRQAVNAALAARRLSLEPRRNAKKRGKQTPMQLCPGQLQACSLPSGSYECLDTTQELNACGACLETGGMDCEAIPNVELVTCALSKCEIHACKSGFRPSLDKTSCVPQVTKRSRKH